ncbi:hypothetical protein [Oceanobacillus jeddahense]|uniref:hypothetical protein n=1 Tax=Oceanobacillus jeddahense TaxID=1462527 RepID=UPI000595E80E|nr:hypothetical protein [Oceanobacillus jeddahense]
MSKEPLNPELVKAYVIAAHGNLEEVKRFLTEEPALLHAVINWNKDDWESGLGAAAHTGNREIAAFLLEKGARMDIFTAAMLGERAIVQSIVESQPSALHERGPHGIPLIRHAEIGGKQAEAVLEYIQGLLSKSKEAVNDD